MREQDRIAARTAVRPWDRCARPTVDMGCNPSKDGVTAVDGDGGGGGVGGIAKAAIGGAAKAADKLSQSASAARNDAAETLLIPLTDGKWCHNIARAVERTEC